MSHVNAYLWVSHGENISSVHNYYPIETKFRSLAFYSRPFQSINDEMVSSFTTDACRIISGSCPIIPITDNITNKKIVYLPPLVFSTRTPENPVISNLTGLYKFKIQKTGTDPEGNDVCVFLENNKILDHNAIITQFGNDQPITYSSIFKLVIDDCQKKRINPADVVLGIYSCQSKRLKYISGYEPLNATDLIPRIIEEEPPKTKIFNYYPNYSFVSPTILTFDKLKNWTPLAGIKHQGCALNVLSFYDIIEENIARERAVCLTLKGTSIFKIVDYIDRYIPNKGDDRGYMIIRYKMANGIDILFEFLNKISNSNQGYAIIFKLYRTEYIQGTQQFSQIGHTVSFAKIDGKLYYIDPQQTITQEIDKNANVESLVASIKGLYHQNNSPNFEFMDIIYTIKTKPFPGDIPSGDIQNFKNTVEYLGAKILTRTTDITHGGKNITKNRKTKRRKLNYSKKSKENNKKTYNKRKYNKRKYSRKYNKQIGGSLDPFEEIMIKIDKQNNIPSLLKVDDEVTA
jgi:hypothetical protein